MPYLLFMQIPPPTAKRTRSPAYPAIGLPQAMDLASTIFRNFQAHAAPVEAIGESLDMKPGGSSLNVRLSALRKFGLLDEEEDEVDGRKSYRLTGLAKDLLLLPTDDPLRQDALHKAALMPVIYDVLWSRFGPELPADSLIRAYLVRDRNFNAQQVDGVIKDFRATVEFAGLGTASDAGSPAVASYESPAMTATLFTRTVPRSPLVPQGSDVVSIPLDDGKFASIPYPMSRASWTLFMKTLELWEPRLVREDSTPDADES